MTTASRIATTASFHGWTAHGTGDVVDYVRGNRVVALAFTKTGAIKIADHLAGSYDEIDRAETLDALRGRDAGKLDAVLAWLEAGMTPEESTHLVGRTNGGSRVFVSIRLTRSNREVRFTDHTYGPQGWDLGISGFAICPGSREAYTAGQISGDLARVTNPAEGWTADDVRSLLETWQAWHLNTLNAESDEQRAAGITYRDNPTHVDSAGYKIGSAWLTRRLPDDVLAEVLRLRALPTGNVPTTY
jgi:hypothetical protein